VQSCRIREERGDAAWNYHGTITPLAGRKVDTWRFPYIGCRRDLEWRANCPDRYGGCLVAHFEVSTDEYELAAIDE
jgi:hypothetical protein